MVTPGGTAPAGGTLTPERVGERFLAVLHRLRRAADERMTASGLSLARTKVLRHLDQSGPVRPGALASVCGVVPHSITDIVDGLERDGLAERQPDPADRRAKLIRLTAKGAETLAAVSATREHLLNLLFGTLDEAEREQLHGLLDKLDAALAALSDPGVTVSSLPSAPGVAAPDPAAARPGPGRSAASPSSGPAPASPVSEGTTSHVIA
jgi:DNA-binding MarR family transcriptional regulator